MKTQMEEKLTADGGEVRAQELTQRLAQMRERLAACRTHPMSPVEFAEFSVSLNAVHAAQTVLADWMTCIARPNGAMR